MQRLPSPCWVCGAMADSSVFLAGVGRMLSTKSKKIPSFHFSIVHEYNSVRNSLLNAGFRRAKSAACNLLWSRHQTEREIHEQHTAYRKLNHWPGSWAIGRKDRLARNVARAQRSHGDAMGICPPTLLLPGDKAKLKLALQEDPKAMWIVKPVNASCGRGIRLVSGASAAAAAGGSMSTSLPGGNKRYVAQRYVQQPYLINNTKFDLRVYCCVTSLDPLRVYVYQEGLVRFATQQYSTSNSEQGNRFAHLTNYSVNKKADGFNKNTSADQDATGSKWSLTALLRHLEEAGVDSAAVRRSIHQLCVKTILCCEPEVTTLSHSAFKGGNAAVGTGTPCFEVYGIDVILDSALRPWVLEVNVSPSLSSSSPMDKRIKTMLMTDTFHMIGFVPFDPAKAAKADEALRKERLLGQAPASPAAGATRSSLGTRTQAADLARMRLADLSPQDIAVICETEDEFARRGHFVRVFPTRKSAAQYGHLFETARYNNLLLDMWLGKWKAQLGDSPSAPKQLQPAAARLGQGGAGSDEDTPPSSAETSPATTPRAPVPVTVAAAVQARASKRSGRSRRPPSGTRRPPSTSSSSSSLASSTRKGRVSGGGSPSPTSGSRPVSGHATAAAQRAADAARARKLSTASRIEQRFAMYRSGAAGTKAPSRPSTAVPSLKRVPKAVAGGAASAPTSARYGPAGANSSSRGGGGATAVAGGAAAAVRSRRALHKQQGTKRKAPPLYSYHAQVHTPSSVTPAAAPVTVGMLAPSRSTAHAPPTTATTQQARQSHAAPSSSLPSAFKQSIRTGGYSAQGQRGEPAAGRFKAPPASPIAAQWSSDDEAPVRPAKSVHSTNSWYRGHLVRAESGGVAFR